MTEIERRRLACGLTRKQLAEKAGVSKAAVQHWEKGNRRPSDESFPTLAKALACDVADIWIPPKPPKRVLTEEESNVRKANREKAAPYIERRKTLGLTKKDLAVKAGIHVETIKTMESGRHFPCWKTRQKIRRALEMPEERFYSEEDRNEIFLELEVQGIIQLAIRKSYHQLRAVNADLDDLYQELVVCALCAIDRYQPGGPATLKTFVERNMDFFIKQWIVKVMMHGLSGKVHYPLPDVRVISLNFLMENGFDAAESAGDFIYTGDLQRKRPHTQPTDQSVCV